MKYLKRSAGYIVLIIALLFLQAYCDLSLPNYTSNIINVGIQQNGIEDSVPEKIRRQVYGQSEAVYGRRMMRKLWMDFMRKREMIWY